MEENGIAKLTKEEYNMLELLVSEGIDKLDYDTNVISSLLTDELMDSYIDKNVTLITAIIEKFNFDIEI